ncbi:MAG TPA: DUF4395 family protein [Thermoanaerobaculia bacterium]|nr:DUF4395 family protein [Thermoanaerobaculia bacterium]
MATVSSTTRRRLEIQGIVGLDDQTLAGTGPWLRLAFALCALFAGIGTVFASPAFLWALAAIAALAAASPVHPFDLLYNYGLRHLTGTGPLPRRGAPTRFACGIGAVWLLVTGWAFQSGALLAGYILGGLLTCSAALVSTTDICLPSLLYQRLFGSLRRSRGTAA